MATAQLSRFWSMVSSIVLQCLISALDGHIETEYAWQASPPARSHEYAVPSLSAAAQFVEQSNPPAFEWWCGKGLSTAR